MKLPTPREEENGPEGPVPHRRKRIQMTSDEGTRERREEEEKERIKNLVIMLAQLRSTQSSRRYSLLTGQTGHKAGLN